MKLRTFTAETMAEALSRVKREVGADAVILHTRTFKRGGVFGFGAKPVVEVTAACGKQVGRARRQKAENSPRAQVARQLHSPPALTLPPSPPPMPAMRDDYAPAGDLIKRTYAAAKSELAATVAVAPPVDHAKLADEMRQVKRMVERMMHEQRKPKTAGDLPDALFDAYRNLLEQEVAEELAQEVVQRVRGVLTEDELNDPAACRGAVLESVKTLLPKPAEVGDGKPRVKGRPRTIALVGPTGVGKTTTVAKLAANFKLRERQRVGLVTLDTYRIAAVEQLRTYAEIIGVPLRVVSSGPELADAIATFSDCDVVLIDTAGRSQRNGDRLEELAKTLELASPDEVHLVLSSTCTQKVLLEVVERFGAIRTDRVIFTKLDEAVSFGVLVNVLRKVDKQLSYVTTGQEVPHQIEPGCPNRLAALVLGGSERRT